MSSLLCAQNAILISRAENSPSRTASGPAASIESDSPIHINGSSAADKGNATVFVGDKIETAKGSAAVITAEGSTVLVPSKTLIVFGDNVIDVGCGGALVTTVKGMSARLLDHRVGVYPTDTYAKFELNTAHGDLQIAVREGSVNVVETTDKDRTLPDENKLLNLHKLAGLKYTFLTAGASLIIPGVGCPVALVPWTVVAPAVAGSGGAVAALATRGNSGSSTSTPVTPVAP